MLITLAPAALTPRANAAASAGPDSRMSCATTIWSGSSPDSRSISMNAVPIARATGSLNWSGTTPRTSYALMISDRSSTSSLLIEKAPFRLRLSEPAHEQASSPLTGPT